MLAITHLIMPILRRNHERGVATGQRCLEIRLRLEQCAGDLLVMV